MTNCLQYHYKIVPNECYNIPEYGYSVSAVSRLQTGGIGHGQLQQSIRSGIRQGWFFLQSGAERLQSREPAVRQGRFGFRAQQIRFIRSKRLWRGSRLLFAIPEHVRSGSRFLFAIPEHARRGSWLLFAIPEYVRRGSRVSGAEPERIRLGTGIFFLWQERVRRKPRISFREPDELWHKPRLFRFRAELGALGFGLYFLLQERFRFRPQLRRKRIRRILRFFRRVEKKEEEKAPL